MNKATDLFGACKGQPKDEAVKTALELLEKDLIELVTVRNPAAKVISHANPQCLASIFDVLNKKVKVFTAIYNADKKDEDQIHPKFFKKHIMTKHNEVYKAWIDEQSMLRNRKALIRKYPRFCVRPEGFKQLEKAIETHNRKLINELLDGVSQSVSKKRKKFNKDYVEYDYCHNNIRPYHTDPDLKNYMDAMIQVSKND